MWPLVRLVGRALLPRVTSGTTSLLMVYELPERHQRLRKHCSKFLQPRDEAASGRNNPRSRPKTRGCLVAMVMDLGLSHDPRENRWFLLDANLGIGLGIVLV